MTPRKWLEFGKIFEGLIEKDWEVSLDSITSDDYIDADKVLFSISLFSDNEKIDNDYLHDTPYEAIKDAYFKHVLDIWDAEEIQLDLSEEILETLYKLSDEKGIPLDEYINDILAQSIQKPIEYAKCCFNCENYEINAITNGYCNYNHICTRNNFTCCEYIQKEDLN